LIIYLDNSPQQKTSKGANSPSEIVVEGKYYSGDHEKRLLRNEDRFWDRSVI
jgi:hypothetical protein